MKTTYRTLAVFRQQGQGMTEYIIIVALIAVAAIATYQLFGTTIRNQTAAMAQEVAGLDGSGSITAAGTAATRARDAAKADDKNSLASYGGQAQTAKSTSTSK